jgi:hypothetical protein
MATYKTNQLYRGPLPVKVTIDGDEFISNEEGELVDPPEHVARLLEGMPEWYRAQGDSPFGPNEVHAHV